MKEKIHPEYIETTITCACGEVIHTRSTKKNIHVEICSKCHPFFTGKQKLVDSAGRVDKYMKRFEKRKPKTKKKNMQATTDDGRQTTDDGKESGDTEKNV